MHSKVGAYTNVSTHFRSRRRRHTHKDIAVCKSKIIQFRDVSVYLYECLRAIKDDKYLFSVRESFQNFLEIRRIRCINACVYYAFICRGSIIPRSLLSWTQSAVESYDERVSVTVQR